MPPAIGDTPATEADVREFGAAVLAKVDPGRRQGRGGGDRSRLVCRDRARAARPHHPSLARCRPREPGQGPQARLLPVARIPDRPAVQRRRRKSAARAEIVRAALGDIGVDLDRMRAAEPDAALGNGGLGRLAACFMDSMAALGIPACGYGIRYDHGLFRQVIKDGWQHEYPGALAVVRQSVGIRAARGGLRHPLTAAGSSRSPRPRAARARSGIPTRPSQAVAYDTPIVGWRGRHVNPLRLWSARAVDPLRLDMFNEGDHIGALSQQARAEAISKILYPSDDTPAGRELRLRQEYFFVSASLQDLVHRHVHSLRQHLRPCRSRRRSSSTTPIRASPSPS